eukprot:TRINITY_DN85782_c0_g1_i1.p1 TRINITY_DN85782_c0_g1~~TRINITY_DN85782_c0_g1_i1.p1  ORF type:complete len:229 (+),score=24.15 TRINITY_DN85782_c0_g1_i1:10-696(+)
MLFMGDSGVGRQQPSCCHAMRPKLSSSVLILLVLASRPSVSFLHPGNMQPSGFGGHRSVARNQHRRHQKRHLAYSRLARKSKPQLFAEELNLIYDSKCSVCQWEVDNLISLGAQGRIAFTDIEAPNYDPNDPRNAGVTYEAGMSKITAVTREGEILIGMPVFAACYETVGLGWLFAAIKMPILGPLLDVAYSWFASVRTDLTRGKSLKNLIADYDLVKRAAACESCDP